MTVILVLGRMGRRQKKRGHNVILILILNAEILFSFPIESGQCVAHKALSGSTHRKHQIYEQTTN